MDCLMETMGKRVGGRVCGWVVSRRLWDCGVDTDRYVGKRLESVKRFEVSALYKFGEDDDRVF